MTDEAAVVLPESREVTRATFIAPLPDTILVSFSHVWRHWGRGDKRWAVLQDISLQLAPGTATCIGGANGAGKTTLLRIATGILAPDTGTVTIDGMTAARSWREYHRTIGFLSAGDRGLYPRLSVRRHLELWTALAFVPRGERKRSVDETLLQFALGDLANRRADRLSQGQRQRLRLALTVVHQPKVLLLDEPRNSLDGDGLEMLARAVGAVLDRGGLVIWCCPIGEEQPIDFDRKLVLEAGRLALA